MLVLTASALILTGLRILTVILFAALLFLVFPSVGVMVYDDWKASAKPTRRARHRREKGATDLLLTNLVERFRAGKLATALPNSVNPGQHKIVRHRMGAA